ncbi:hypothetical protein FBY35_3837 [Streptomyces sp. SLBN-118]|nr:hypothetical protein FBY35_3837 [Streptomyces sp. SLBN-118]
MAAAEVDGRDVGFVQRIAVEPHLTSCSVEVLPEGERQVDVITEGHAPFAPTCWSGRLDARYLMLKTAEDACPSPNSHPAIGL